MFDNRHDFDWNPKHADTWLRQMKAIKRHMRDSFPKSDEQGLTIKKYPTPRNGPLDPFGRDD